MNSAVSKIICGIFLSVFSANVAEAAFSQTLRIPRASRERRFPPRRLHLYNDLSRQTLNVDMLQNGVPVNEEIIPFTGKGVVIGMVDCGIDPRHPAFFDPNTGDSRIGMYVITSSEMESESGKLEYSVYYPTQEEIDNQVIDVSANGHGTHTSATAGGSNCGIPYFGMAPEATFVMTSVGEDIYEDEIEFGITNALDYARQNNMPCVASLSLGSCGGMHDGSGSITNLLEDELADAGQIVCFAAGNDGLNNVSIFKDFNADSTPMKTAFGLGNWGGKVSNIGCYFVGEQDDFKIAFTLIKTGSGVCEEVAVSQFFNIRDIPVDGINIIHAISGLSHLLASADSQLVIRSQQGYSNNIGLEIVAFLDWAEEESNYTIGAIIDSPSGGIIRGFADYSSLFCSYGLPGYTSGNPSQSISDFCTSPYVISVGGTVEREYYIDIEGNRVFSDTENFGTLHSSGLFSSYGSVPEKLPHVMASGVDVISAIPDYSTLTRAASVTKNDVIWYYGVDSGTSMATPAIAGVIALWLQADPNLTRNDILEVMKVAGTPDYATDKSAYGVPDAYKGLKYIIEKASTTTLSPDTDTMSKLDKLMIKYLPSGDVECVVPFATQGGIYYLYSADGRLINSADFIGPTFQVSVPQAGISILKVITPQGSATQKLH